MTSSSLWRVATASETEKASTTFDLQPVPPAGIYHYFLLSPHSYSHTPPAVLGLVYERIDCAADICGCLIVAWVQ
jgi:hypothetical protein